MKTSSRIFAVQIGSMANLTGILRPRQKKMPRGWDAIKDEIRLIATTVDWKVQRKVWQSVLRAASTQ